LATKARSKVVGEPKGSPPFFLFWREGWASSR
jgi:hypothetical protein